MPVSAGIHRRPPSTLRAHSNESGMRRKNYCVTSTEGLRRDSYQSAKFHPVPESEFVVDHSQIILHHMFGGSDSFGDFLVLQAFGNELDDSVFTFIGDTVPIASICRHACLRYNRVASFTRLIPPVIPKRRNNRLK